MKNDTVYGCILISRRGHICVVQGRSTEKWSFPKGHPNSGETPFQCASRETCEETGIKIPWQTHRPISLAVGHYYIVFVATELVCYTFDENEILQVKWFSIDELKKIRGNVDINTFLRRLDQSAQDNLWSLIKRRCKGRGFLQLCQDITVQT